MSNKTKNNKDYRIWSPAMKIINRYLKNGWELLWVVVIGVIAGGVGSFVLAAFVAGGVYAVIGDICDSFQDTFFIALTLCALAGGLIVALAALNETTIRVCGRRGIAFVWRPIAALFIGVGTMMLYVDWTSMFTPEEITKGLIAIRVAYCSFIIVLAGQWIVDRVITKIGRRRAQAGKKFRRLGKTKMRVVRVK